MLEKAPATGVSSCFDEMLPTTNDNNNKTVQTKKAKNKKTRELKAAIIIIIIIIIIIVLLETCEVLFEGLWKRKVWVHGSQCTQANQSERKKQSLKKSRALSERLRIFPDYTIEQRDLT